MISIKYCLKLNSKQPPPPPPPDQASTFIQCVRGKKKRILHFGNKEASGMPLFSAYLLEFAEQLSERRQTYYTVDLEYHKPGQKPACDGAVCATIMRSGDKKPTNHPQVLYKYKPVVDTRFMSVNPSHLMEVLIQGYYCLHQYELKSIIHCLTDLEQWYYFHFTLEGDRKVMCTWYNEFNSESKVASHVHFLDCNMNSE